MEAAPNDVRDPTNLVPFVSDGPRMMGWTKLRGAEGTEEETSTTAGTTVATTGTEEETSTTAGTTAATTGTDGGETATTLLPSGGGETDDLRSGIRERETVEGEEDKRGDERTEEEAETDDFADRTGRRER